MNTTLFPIRHPRFRLDVPTEWAKQDIGVHFAEYTVSPSIKLHVRWMTHLVVDEVTWIEGVMREGFSDRATLSRALFQSTQSERGWPMVYAGYKVTDGEVNGVSEERVGAFYRIVHTHGEAVFRLRDGARWDDHAATLRPLLFAGHVDWPIYQEQELMYPLLGMRA